MNDIRLRKLVAVLSLFAASGALATTGYAQATTTTTTTTATPTTAEVTAPASSNEEPTKMEQYVVTGSNIPQAADALSIPVAIIGSSVMEDSGIAADTLDLLRKVAPNISGIGSENAQIATASNFGGASVNIKGLPTLVLVDGRRVANDPAEATGGSQFVDLNLIPPAAIDRVEVLEDGASAIYGSDAVGGVINIILKKDYNGWEMGAHYGFSTGTGRYEERSGYLTGGVSNGKTSITVSFDYAQHNELYLSSRPYTNPIYGTYTAPGTLEVYDNLSGSDNFYKMTAPSGAPPGGGSYTLQQLITMGDYTPETTGQAFVALNLAAGETLTSALKRYSAMTNIEHKIFGEHLVGFANIIAANTKTWSSLNAQPLVPFLEDAWTDINVEGFPSSPPPAGVSYIPVTAPTNPFSAAFLDQNQTTPESGPGFGNGSGEAIYVRNRYLAYPRLYQNDSTLYRVVGGLKGDITDDLHWEAAANIDRYTLSYTNPGLFDTADLQNAWADGQLNQFAINNPSSAFVGVIGTAFVNMLSTLNGFDFKLDGTPFDLPGGKLGFAAGASFVREGLSAVPDINSLPNSSGTTQGWSNATTFKEFSADRTVTSYFGEVSVPVTGSKENIPGAYAINVDAAVRYDSYSGNVGSTTNPQVNFSWAPMDDQFKIRASAGKSFIAPELFELDGPISSGSTASITYNTVGGGTKSAQFNQTGGSNPFLKPTTAHSWTAGFVFTPKAVSGLSITIDYSDITEKQIVGTVPAGTIIQSVETSGSSSPYIGEVHYNSPTGASPTGPGGISNHSPQSIYVIQNLVNLAGQKIDSTDINVDYTWKAAGIGKFDISSVWTWYNSYKLELIPTEQFYNYTGEASQNEGTIPKWRTYTTFSWMNNGVNAFVGVTYVASVTDVGVGGDNQYGFEGVSSFTAFDLGLSYDFSHLHISKWLDGLKVQIGVNNVANKLPPLAVNAFPNTNADVGTYDGAVGRMFYVNGKYSF
jgi:iron complex outermembrane receptor protein